LFCAPGPAANEASHHRGPRPDHLQRGAVSASFPSTGWRSKSLSGSWPGWLVHVSDLGALCSRPVEPPLRSEITPRSRTVYV